MSSKLYSSSQSESSSVNYFFYLSKKIEGKRPQHEFLTHTDTSTLFWAHFFVTMVIMLYFYFAEKRLNYNFVFQFKYACTKNLNTAGTIKSRTKRNFRLVGSHYPFLNAPFFLRNNEFDQRSNCVSTNTTAITVIK